MYLSWVFLGISAFSLTVLSVSVDQCSKAQVQPPFEFLTLTRNWPPTLCLGNQKVLTSKSCRIPEDVNTWTIHGLWPDREKSPDINNCLPQQQFDYDKIKIVFFMFLREHEWCTHGSCLQDCAELKGEENYFRKTIELHKNYSIDMALKSASILPGIEYSLSYITKAIYNAFKMDPIVQCLTVNNTEYLAEIRICFQKDFTLMNCPVTKLEGTHACGPANLIYYPEMHHI
ncbi:ribonuclease T2-like isoform X2 [Anneissia japonica]|uniref:ribonuclease T2-like isoform X2 n=1 Tax=Anneissia japonica TaxID=1529436 RepID=UPI0014254EBA|nr:ribonuclease T2-like isoform X2 [Anneissia japonica]